MGIGRGGVLGSSTIKLLETKYYDVMQSVYTSMTPVLQYIDDHDCFFTCYFWSDMFCPSESLTHK